MKTSDINIDYREFRTASRKNPLDSYVAGFGGMILFFLAALILQIPLNFRWYRLHRSLMFPSRLILGWLFLPLWIIVSILSPNRHREVVFIIVAVGLGFLLDVLVRFLWTGQWLGKLLVLAILLSQILFGVYLFLFAGDIVRPPTEICRFAPADRLSIRILGYGPVWGTVHDNYFVLSSQDGGQSWQQVFVQEYVSWDLDPPPPDCEGEVLYYQSLLGDEFIWMWTRENLSVSNDGGRAWRSWSPSCGVRERCDYGSIAAVTFEDKRRGHMKVIPLRTGVTTDLYTSDGGVSWHSEP